MKKNDYSKNSTSTRKSEIFNYWTESLEVGFSSWIEKHGYSEATKKTYWTMINSFFTFLEHYSIAYEDVNKSIIDLFFRDRETLFGRNKKLSPGTKVRYLWLISDILENMLECGFIQVNNAISLLESNRKNMRGKAAKRLPTVLSGTETDLLLNYIDSLPSHYSGLREKCSLLLLLGTGLRVQELCDLKTVNIYLNDNPAFLRVIGKFDKERIIPIPESIVDTLQDFIDIKNALKAKSSSYFLSSIASGNPYSPSGIYRMVKTSMIDANIKKEKMSPHVLRHTYCTKQLTAIGKEGSKTTLQDVKSWMGHESLATTAIYDHVVVSINGSKPVI